MVWSDTLQSVCTFFSMLIILVIGCVTAGGPANIYRINSEGHRLEIFKYVLSLQYIIYAFSNLNIEKEQW